MKTINRKNFLEFLKKETSTKKIAQEKFCGKNIYFLTAENTRDIEFQIEFIPQSKRYLYTILLRGIHKEADFLHTKTVEYLRSLKLGRNLLLDTEYKQTLI